MNTIGCALMFIACASMVALLFAAVADAINGLGISWLSPRAVWRVLWLLVAMDVLGMILVFAGIRTETAARESLLYTVEVGGKEYKHCKLKSDCYYTEDGSRIHFGKESHLIKEEK